MYSLPHEEGSMILPYDYEALWSKAKVFMNRAMDPDAGRSFDEQAMWATIALELLGKAALARVSPLLIAELTDEGVNLLIATGLIDGPARFTSISASMVFKRCQRAFKPFSTADAQAMASARNEYLHGPANGFSTLKPETWWPRYWALASVLVNAQDKQIEDLVGPDREMTVQSYLRQNSKNVEHHFEALVTRAKQRLAQHRAGTLPARVQMEWIANPDLTVGDRFSAIGLCPACGAAGTLEGEEPIKVSYDGVNINDSTADLSDVSSITYTVWAEYFSCSICHLILDRHELTEISDMAEFEVTFDNSESD
jgi:hypothetical protein